MSRRHLLDLIGLFLGLAIFALLWVVPYAAVSDFRSGETAKAKRWAFITRVTTENPRLDWSRFPPVSPDYGFPVAYKQAYVYGQDPRYRARVIENALIAAGIVLAIFAGLAALLYFTRRSTQHGDARFGSFA